MSFERGSELFLKRRWFQRSWSVWHIQRQFPCNTPGPLQYDSTVPWVYLRFDWRLQMYTIEITPAYRALPHPCSSFSSFVLWRERAGGGVPRHTCSSGDCFAFGTFSARGLAGVSAALCAGTCEDIVCHTGYSIISHEEEVADKLGVVWDLSLQYT